MMVNLCNTGRHDRTPRVRAVLSGLTEPRELVCIAGRYWFSSDLTIGRSRSVFSGVHPGGCMIAAQAFTTSLT